MQAVAFFIFSLLPRLCFLSAGTEINNSGEDPVCFRAASDPYPGPGSHSNR